MLRKIVKAIIPHRLFEAIEPYGHLGEAIVMNIALGFPARGLKVIGVTGTDGKTTTSTYIYTMLKEAGYKVGLQTTVAYGAEELRPNDTHMTVVTSRHLLTRIKVMRQEGIEWLVLETTSHALAQHRVWGIKYVLAVWTNLTPEAMDYHGTFERYRAAKVRLFSMVGHNRQGLRLGIVNADDENMRYFAAAVPETIRYGLSHGDLRATAVKTTADGSHYSATYKGRTVQIHTHLPANFNVYNSLAAVGVGFALRLTNQQIEEGIAAVMQVPGRMNNLRAGQKFQVIIDFAHTPAAFEKVFEELRPVTKGQLIVVFGATGNRDTTKRPVMGEVAAKYGNLVVVTEDDDGTEDGLAIMEAVAAGAERGGKVRGKDLILEHDRRKAITYAINAAGPNDTVVLLGIGHQSSLNTNAGEIPWSEADVATEAIRHQLSR
jgi:UDP-N-acetylmuramoyl-L-alanyl-D-glutamate--2,6-diaminopimelate ligase